MFGRGNWSVFGVESTSLPQFQETLENKLSLFELSQFAASVVTKSQSRVTSGINPFGSPRADELDDPESVLNPDMVNWLTTPTEEREPLSDLLWPSVFPHFGYEEKDFSLGNQRYGFWFVQNDYKDVTHAASKKEALAYEGPGRPFKFLNKEEKKAVEEQVQAGAVMERKQFPVIVDFQNGRVYAETTNADAIVSVRDMLSKMGAKTFGMRWDFGSSEWPNTFLNLVVKETKFTAEMQQRADDLARFRSDEIEKFEDKSIEKIVSSFFAISELPTSNWAGLSTPAKLKLHATSEAISTSGVSAAFELMQKSNDAELVSASVAFQELTTIFTKKGDEKQVRNDLFTIDINDQVNNQDVGVAFLRGFDLPRFKREIKTALKAKGSLEVRDYWYMWQEGMHTAILLFVDNITEALELDKSLGLAAFEVEPESSDE